MGSIHCYSSRSEAAGLDIGVDLDGVVYDFVDVLRGFIHRTTGRPLESMPSPSTWSFYADDWGLTLAEFLDFAHAGVASGVVFGHGEPYPGVVEGTRRLRHAGHSVHLVTDRASWGPEGMAEKLTRQWLEAAGVSFSTLTLCADKTAVRTDVFIEDHPSNFAKLREHGVDVFLRVHAYNTHVDCPSTRRVVDFSGFVDRVLHASMAG